MESNNIVILNDDDGNKVEFEFLNLIQHREKICDFATCFRRSR